MLLLSQTFTSLEKQRALDQAVTAGDSYHLSKCGPTSLSQTRPSQEEEEGREKKDKGIGYLEGNLDSQFQQEIRQCLGMTLSGTLKTTRVNGVLTISSTAFLRV
jgi:hypothetical protein